MTVLILRHMPDTPLGLFEKVLAQYGQSVTFIDVPDGQRFLPPSDIAGMVILGGSMSVCDVDSLPYMQHELAFIQDVIEADKPVFGICLGAQLLSKALGGEVRKNPVKEIGWTPIELSAAGQTDPILSQLPNHTPQFQWHEDTYSLPKNAVHLARTSHCSQQAFRYKQNVYGVQFHPEVTSEFIQTWLQTSSSVSAEEKQAIWKETQTHYNNRQALSWAMFQAFCDLHLP